MERIAVLGAGVMGAQIAALLANAGCRVDLLDMEADGDPAGRARAACEHLRRRAPEALHLPEMAGRILPGSLERLAVVARADWVIEAVLEDLTVKRALYAALEPHLRADAVLSTNTSGLSIRRLGAGLSAAVARRFVGVHFFNPPRHMRLVEVIPGPCTETDVVEAVTEVLRRRLGKEVVRCRDTPNFIANRLGIFAILEAVHRMAAAGLSVETVDAVTGPLLGRPRSATLRLCDLIGLDTLLHVAATARQALVDDPERETFAPPAVIQALVEAGRLGVKSGAGFYRKGKDGLEALVPPTGPGGPGGYRRLAAPALDLPFTGALADRLAAVWRARDPAATFAREHLAATLAYCAACAPEIAAGVEDVDRALRWGFGWEAGPFEILDLVGPAAVRDTVAAAGMTVPDLLADLSRQAGRVYVDGGTRVWAVTRRGHRPLRPAGRETDAERLAGATVTCAGRGVRLLDLGEGAGVIELRGKLNVLPPDAVRQVRDIVEQATFELLVLTGAGEHLCAGADLKWVLTCIDSRDWEELEAYVRSFQEMTTALRYAPVPVVCAAHGLALGGGCELCLASARRVVATELRLGLVETRLGVVPAGGGCKEMVRRFGADVDAFVPGLWEGRMSDNAPQARAWGFLEAADVLLADGWRLLSEAIVQARGLLEAGWVPPTPETLVVAGASGYRRLCDLLEARRGQGDISDHDAEVGRLLAKVVCGGEGETADAVSESRLLDLEAEAFLSLCATAPTRARMEHMLRTGKPLRN